MVFNNRINLEKGHYFGNVPIYLNVNKIHNYYEISIYVFTF